MHARADRLHVNVHTHACVLLRSAQRNAHAATARNSSLRACRFESEQVFSEVMETQIKAVSLIDGTWYVRLYGDLAGRVTGAAYDATAADGSLAAIPVAVRRARQGEHATMCMLGRCALMAECAVCCF